MQTIAHILRAWLVIFAILLPNSLVAESLRDDVNALYQSKLEDLFLYFHQNPELSTMEQQFAAPWSTVRGFGENTETNLQVLIDRGR